MYVCGHPFPWHPVLENTMFSALCMLIIIFKAYHWDSYNVYSVWYYEGCYRHIRLALSLNKSVDVCLSVHSLTPPIKMPKYKTVMNEIGSQKVFISQEISHIQDHFIGNFFVDSWLSRMNWTFLVNTENII